MIEDPVLQIVHVSDIHIDEAPPDIRDRSEYLTHWIASQAHRFEASRVPGTSDVGALIAGLLNEWQEGAAGYHPGALRRFFRFVEQVAGDPAWAGVPTWLIDTGDLTTFGDDESLTAGHDGIRALTQRIDTLENIAIHGNHDAWPRMFPLFGGVLEIQPHRARLRERWYPAAQPALHLSAPVPGTSREIQLYSMNTVLHERLRNTFALGEVAEDQYWRHHRRARRRVQMARLEELVRKNNGNGPKQSLRILALHHPLSAAAYRPEDQNRRRMKMVNARDTGRWLGPCGGAGPLVHVVLSGHTHHTYPPCAAPLELMDGEQSFPLGPGQVELVVGTLAQHAPDPAALGRRHRDINEMHQCQVLRVSRVGNASGDEGDDGEGCRLVLERKVAVRPLNRGDYRFVSELDPAGSTDAKISFDL